MAFKILFGQIGFVRKTCSMNPSKVLVMMLHPNIDTVQTGSSLST